VPGIDFDLAFSTVNVVLAVVATLMLIRVGFQVRELSRSTKLLKDAADRMSSLDRNSASQIARIARDISADIGKLRHLDSTDKEAQFQSLR
jgi:hypothetical protein